jgi:hypothetical protein
LIISDSNETANLHKKNETRRHWDEKMQKTSLYKAHLLKRDSMKNVHWVLGKQNKINIFFQKNETKHQKSTYIWAKKKKK